MAMPLEGVKVVELGTLIAAPFAARLFAEFGAEVVKIESPAGGDPLRRWSLLYKDTSLWWRAQARNKKSVTADLSHPEGQALVKKLIEQADVVIENFRPGTLEKWGLGWETLSQINPRLVMLRISGFGQTGPYRDKPGFGAIGESMGGLRELTGYPDRPPVRVGVSIGDSLAALYGVIGALMALRHRDQRGGGGQFIDVALNEAVFGVTESLISEYGMFGHLRARTGAALPGVSPSNTYRCADDRYVVIAGNTDGIFKRLMRAIGRPDLGADPELAHNDGRVRQNAKLDEVIGAWAAGRTLAEALRILEAAEVPSGPIYTAKDIFEDPQYRSRGMIERHSLDDGQPIDLPGIVPKLSDTPGATRWLGPELGEHTDEVLERLGYSADLIRRLRAEGVI